MSRTARIERSTSETKVTVELDLDGSGRAEVATGVGFFDHMLYHLARHGGLDLRVHTDGDVQIDAHHTVEDTTLVLGAALSEALGDKAGITRFGHAILPMDEVLVRAAVDVSGRPYVVHEEPPLAPLIVGTGVPFPTSLTRHVWESLGASARLTLHVSVLRAGREGAVPDPHHVIEAQFKAVARALRQAVAPDPRTAGGIPSTKGAL